MTAGIVFSRHSRGNRDLTFCFDFFLSFFSLWVWSLVSSLLLSISHTLHHSRILCNKCSLASLELQLWWNTWWGSASDPWSAQLEAWLNVQHLQQEKSKTRFDMRQYINELLFNIYISLMFSRLICNTPCSFFSSSLCLFALAPLLCLLSGKHPADTLSKESYWYSWRGIAERERERWRNESHTHYISRRTAFYYQQR